MSIQAVAWALEQDLPARPKLVLVSLCNHANNVDGYCWLKAETIAKEAACTSRSVYTFIGGLVRNGFIRKEVRRGEDGKQRANDNWILFSREEKDWDWGAHPDEDVPQGDGVGEGSSEPDAPTDGVPDAPISPGEPHERHDTRQPVDIHVPSPGPSEGAFTRKRIAEPSKTNPKASSAGARVAPALGAAPRAYRPPPVEPQAADPSQPTKQIFVYAGSRAYDAWAAHMARQNRTRSWSLTAKANIDGEWRTGWYFPSLFPPPDKSSTDPPKESSAA